ncbi:MAG TPA: DUF3830 family protein [bacterium]|nr:DUF3830 family protein [bacterium]
MLRRTIELEVEGVKARAALFDKEFPKTCDAIWDILPLKEPVGHGQWTGREVWMELMGDQRVILEQEGNHPLFVLPGDICYAYRQPHCSRGTPTGVLESVELAIYYGRDCRLWNVRGGAVVRGKLVGYRTHGYRMHIAHIFENREQIQRVLDRVRQEGFKTMSITRGEPVELAKIEPWVY